MFPIVSSPLLLFQDPNTYRQSSNFDEVREVFVEDQSKTQRKLDVHGQPRPHEEHAPLQIEMALAGRLTKIADWALIPTNEEVRRILDFVQFGEPLKVLSLWTQLFGDPMVVATISVLISSPFLLLSIFHRKRFQMPRKRGRDDDSKTAIPNSQADNNDNDLLLDRNPAIPLPAVGLALTTTEAYPTTVLTTSKAWLTSIELSTPIEAIGADFLRDCVHLLKADLRGLSSATSIDDYFLSNCTALTEVDLSALTLVKSIGDFFLNDCNALTAVDLSALTSVTSVGHGFLNGCMELTTVDVSALTSVASIRHSFLAGCKKLTAVDLSALTSVTSIGTCCFDECPALTAVDLSALTSVTSIGDCFFCDCKTLTAVDLSVLTSVTSIGTCFFGGCTALTAVDLSALTSVTSIGTCFFGGCTALTAVDLSASSSSWIQARARGGSK